MLHTYNFWQSFRCKDASSIQIYNFLAFFVCLLYERKLRDTFFFYFFFSSWPRLRKRKKKENHPLSTPSAPIHRPPHTTVTTTITFTTTVIPLIAIKLRQCSLAVWGRSVDGNTAVSCPRPDTLRQKFTNHKMKPNFKVARIQCPGARSHYSAENSWCYCYTMHASLTSHGSPSPHFPSK